ncbi:MAG: hypothetical protein ACR2N1_10470 [Rubripirellula sp.]
MATKRFAIRMLLLVLIATGLACTVYSNLRLAGLREVHDELRMRVGIFEGADPAKVRVVRAGVPEDLIASGINDSKVWRYRISLPAKYHLCCESHEGLVKADAPGGASSYSRNWVGPNSEPSEITFSVSFIKDNGQWTLSVIHTGGSNGLYVPQDFPISSPEKLVIDEVVDFGVTRSFGPDEAICLLRIREKGEALNRDGTKKHGLYRGFGFYMFEDSNKEAFSAWTNGEISSMQEMKK